MHLALETSTNICSVAYKDSDGNVYEKRTEVRGSHSEKLFLFMDELKKEYGFEIDQLHSVIVSEGPGSYTGLRISASAVKGLLFQSDVKLLSANTLASFAVSALTENPELKTIHGVIDARRVHLYHQRFDYSEGKLTSGDRVEVIPIEQFEKLVKPGEAVIGTGLKRIDKQVLDGLETFDSSYITARSLFALPEMDASGSFIREMDPRDFEPKYYTSRQG